MLEEISDDVVLAFPGHKSKCAIDCINQVKKRNTMIDVFIVTYISSYLLFK